MPSEQPAPQASDKILSYLLTKAREGVSSGAVTNVSVLGSVAGYSTALFGVIPASPGVIAGYGFVTCYALGNIVQSASRQWWRQKSRKALLKNSLEIKEQLNRVGRSDLARELDDIISMYNSGFISKAQLSEKVELAQAEYLSMDLKKSTRGKAGYYVSGRAGGTGSGTAVTKKFSGGNTAVGETCSESTERGGNPPVIQ
jgi:hypothetical protein